MFLYISKTLGLFLDPFFLTLLLLAGAVALRRLRFPLLIAALAISLICGLPAAGDVLARSLEAQYPDRGIAALPETQAIVVLGGSVQGASGVHGASRITEASDRLLATLRLYQAKKAALVVCSGGNAPLLSQAGEAPEAQVMSGLLREWGVPAEAILTESGSLDTRQNALESYALLSARGIRKILLVTSAMHMPRAAAAFRKAGFEVVPAPADFRTGWGATPLGWAPNAATLLDSANALHEWIGWWVYRLRGWV